MQTDNESASSAQSDRSGIKTPKDLRKTLCCSICFLVTGVFLIISGAFVPKVMNSVVLSQAKKGSYLTPENEKYWDGIPGYLDMGIYWNQYFYNCTNAMDVSVLIAAIVLHRILASIGDLQEPQA